MQQKMATIPSRRYRIVILQQVLVHQAEAFSLNFHSQ